MAAKISNREKLLTEGLRVVHERGFTAASVRDIVQAAGVPQGSFTNHFASKEAFALEILDLYHRQNDALRDRTLLNDALPPLQRLREYIESATCGRSERSGCMIGNFSIEASEHSEPIRQRLVEIFAETQAAIAYCLKAAVRTGELPPDQDCEELAGFFFAGLQGAILCCKAERNPAPVERFKRVFFSLFLE